MPLSRVKGRDSARVDTKEYILYRPIWIDTDHEELLIGHRVLERVLPYDTYRRIQRVMPGCIQT